MKIILLIFIGFYKIMSSQERLITRNSNLTTAIITKPTPPLRLARDVSEDTLMDFSKEDAGQSNEFIPSYNERPKYFIRFKSENQTQNNNIARVPRKSSENITDSRNYTYRDNSRNDQKFIKKPIPKFNDIEYDDNFQDKVNKSPVKVADSGEHEDEDFNLGDYDFDVNHDEFIGRGKPLEPRTKMKDVKDIFLQPQPRILATTNTKISDVKMQSKVHVTAVEGTISNKKERAIANEKVSNKPINKIKESDYYDDTTIKDVAKETKVHDREDEFNEENDESKELERKSWSVRTARSAWNILNISKSREKTSTAVSQTPTILPMFPQIPYDRQMRLDVKYQLIS